MVGAKNTPTHTLVSYPDPTLKEGKGVWWIWTISLIWLARCARTDTAVMKQTMDLIGHGPDRTWGQQFKFIQLAMALCIPAVGESYDYMYAKAAISLERSNSFPWTKDCVQILFPPWGWGLGTRLHTHMHTHNIKSRYSSECDVLH